MKCGDDNVGGQLPECVQHFKRVEDHITFLDRRMSDTAAVLDKRLGAMNEFREALKDQTSMMLTRAEHEAYLQKVEADLRILRSANDKLDGKASQSNLTVTFAIAFIAAISGLLALFLQLVHNGKS